MERNAEEDKKNIKLTRKDDNLTDLNISRLKSSGLKNQYVFYCLSTLCGLLKGETYFEFFEFPSSTRLKAFPLQSRFFKINVCLYQRRNCSWLSAVF